MNTHSQSLLPPQPGDPVAAFERERRRMLGIAYRMLGSLSEAEDIVQDAYMRWQAVTHDDVESPAAYLTRLTTRLCIDALKAAQRRRTEYVGPWLPEPLIGWQHDRRVDDPAALHELADDLSMAFLLLLERLTPLERAVFLLHESFGYSYDEIADVIGHSPEYCRQIARRARRHLDHAPRSQPADPAEHDRLLTHFLAAAQHGELQQMISLLAHDAVLYSDGGGKAQAARQPISGAAHVARFILGVRDKVAGHVEYRPATINGHSGLLTYVDGRLAGALTIHVHDGIIQEVFLVVNPDKLPGQ